MSYISNDLLEQVTALEAREKAHGKRAKRLAPVCLGLAAIAGVTSLMARGLGPSKQLSLIDVPAEVSALFSPVVTGSGGLPFSSRISGLGNLAESFLPVAIGMTLVVTVVGVGAALFQGDMVAGVKRGATGMLLFTSVSFTNFFLSPTVNPGSAPSSSRDGFMEAVVKHRYNAVLRGLEAVEMHETTAGAYVLAQVAIAEDDDSVRAERKAKFERAVASPPVGPAFTPKGRALYAIEHAAFGAAQSPPAVAYEDERLSIQWWASAVSVILGLLAATAGGVSLGFLALRRILAQRVHRIQALLN